MPISLEDFFRVNSYREFSVPAVSHAEKFYQKKIVSGTEQPIKRFINIFQWDLHKVHPQVPEGKTFDVEESFETDLDGCWWKGMYYGLSEAQLIALLPQIEERFRAVFACTGGKSDD